jgi:hypothetical protein
MQKLLHIHPVYKTHLEEQMWQIFHSRIQVYCYKNFKIMTAITDKCVGLIDADE